MKQLQAVGYDVARIIIAFGVASFLYWAAIRAAKNFPATANLASTVQRFTTPGS